MREAQSKLSVATKSCDRLEALDTKMEEQSLRLDQVHVNVNLSCDTLGKVQHEQAVARHLFDLFSCVFSSVYHGELFTAVVGLIE
ncbi:hypothetical protein D1007_28991 [Hordeum vulgare]|nr:hypothetical protein D1007_28991 [Hordeum vulgare]